RHARGFGARSSRRQCANRRCAATASPPGGDALMTISTWPAIGRQFLLWTIVSTFLVLGAAVDTTVRAETAEPPSLDSIKSSLDEIESSVGSDEITAEALATFRETLNTATDALRAKIDELEPRTREAEERLKQLGPAPAKDAAPESADIAKEREELTKQFSDLDGELKQARVLSLRVDQLSDRVSQKRHSLYASELFARSPSVLDPFFWLDTFQALPKEMRTAKALLETWFGERRCAGAGAGGGLILGGVLCLAGGLAGWLFPRFGPPPTGRPAGKAWAALGVFVWFAARTPLAAGAALLAFEALGLLTTRL